MNRHDWTISARRIVIVAVVLPIALMTGTLRAITVHAHGHDGAHDHYHAIFAAPAAPHDHDHPHDHAPGHAPDPGHDRVPGEPPRECEGVTVLAVNGVDQATIVQAAADISHSVPTALPLLAILDAAPAPIALPPGHRSRSSDPLQSHICRLVHTSHALLL